MFFVSCYLLNSPPWGARKFGRSQTGFNHKPVFGRYMYTVVPPDMQTGPCVHSNSFLDNVCGGGRNGTSTSDDDSDGEIQTGSDAPEIPIRFNWRADAVLGCLQQ